MGFITISAVSISIAETKRDNIFTNSAKVYHDITAVWVPSADDPVPDAGANAGSSGSSTSYSRWYTYEYDNLTFSISYSPAGTNNSVRGYTTVTGLNAGSANTITATATVSGRQTIITHTRSDSREWNPGWYDPKPTPQVGKPGDDNYEPATPGVWHDGYWGPWLLGTEYTSSSASTITTQKTSNSITVYTRPGIFSDYGFSIDTIICSSAGLTAKKVENWVTHCNNLSHWYNQNTINTADGCIVSSGDLITADWYNTCVAAMPINKPPTVIGGATGTIITADIINLLGTGISKGDN